MIGAPTIGGGNTNANSLGSNYASSFGHGTTPLIERFLTGVKKKRKSKAAISNAAPKQFYLK